VDRETHGWRWESPPGTNLEIFPLQHPGHGEFRGKSDHGKGVEFGKPLTVKNNLGFLRIKNFEDLLFITFRIFGHILTGQGLSGLRLAGGITNHTSKVTNQKVHIMAKILKMLQLLQQNCMAQMQIRSRWIKTGLHPQWNPGCHRFFQFFNKFFAGNTINDSPLNEFYLFINGRHG